MNNIHSVLLLFFSFFFLCVYLVVLGEAYNVTYDCENELSRKRTMMVYEKAEGYCGDIA